MTEVHEVHLDAASRDTNVVQPFCTCGWTGRITRDASVAEQEGRSHVYYALAGMHAIPPEQPTTATTTQRLDALTAAMDAMRKQLDQLAMGVAMLLGYRPEVEAERERRAAFLAAHDCRTRPFTGTQSAYSRCSCGWECAPTNLGRASDLAHEHMLLAAAKAGVTWP